MKDLHNVEPAIPLQISKVGVKGVRKRLFIARDEPYQIFATLNMYITLPKNSRGANMSRFLEALERIEDKTTSLESFVRALAGALQGAHGSPAIVEAFSEFPYKVVKFDTTEKRVFPFYFIYNNGVERLGVKVDAMSACPCSYENAGIPHTQRIIVDVSVEGRLLNIPVGRFVDVVNASASSPIYYCLKRDEEVKVLKNIKPRFVEDIIRNIVYEMQSRPYFKGLFARIGVESFESIHPHQVYAYWEGVI